MTLTLTLTAPVVAPTGFDGTLEALFGPSTTVAENKAAGSWIEAYEQAFEHYAPLHRASDGDNVYGVTQQASGAGGGHYYDRGLIWFMRSRRESDPAKKAQYLAWGVSQVEAYRLYATETNVNGVNNTPSYWGQNLGGTPLWMYPRGLWALAEYYDDQAVQAASNVSLVNQHLASAANARAAIARLPDMTCNLSYWWDNMHDTMATDPTGSASSEGIDNREQGRLLQSLLVAYLSGATSTVGMNYLAKLTNGVPRVLSSQGDDGSWGTKDLEGSSKIFMMGVLMDVFIELLTLDGSPYDGTEPAYATVRQDIIDAMILSAGWIWRECYVYEFLHNAETSPVENGRHQTAALRYVWPPLGGPSNFGSETGAAQNGRPAGSLNGMTTNLFYFLGYLLGDARYTRRADAILQGYLHGSGTLYTKEFNEGYSYTHKGFAWRGDIAMPGSPNRLLSDIASDLTITRTIGWAAALGSTATVTKPGTLGSDGVTPYTVLTVGPAVKYRYDFVSNTGFPSNTKSTAIFRARRLVGGGTAFRARLMNSTSVGNTGAGAKFTFSVAEGQVEKFTLSGPLLTNTGIGNGSSTLELGGWKPDNTSDATVPVGDVAFEHIMIFIGDVEPVETPPSFALGVALTGINVPTRIEITGGSYSVNGGPAISVTSCAVAGDIITSVTSGAVIKVGRVPGLHAGRSVTVP